MRLEIRPLLDSSPGSCMPCVHSLLDGFHDITLHDDFERLKLNPTRQVDSLDLPVCSVRTLDAARVTLYFTVFQLILWYRTGAIHTLASMITSAEPAIMIGGPPAQMRASHFAIAGN